MIKYCKQNLNELKLLLESVNVSQYQFKSALLSGASIGQHIRHILEFYICLINAKDSGVLNYDNRERNLLIESDINYALTSIEHIYICFEKIKIKSKLILEGNYSEENGLSERIESTFHRELAYNLEHSIHHQALIRIGLNEQNLGHLIEENFGVAPATIRFKETLRSLK